MTRLWRVVRQDLLLRTAFAAGLASLAASRLTNWVAPAWSSLVNGATDVLMLALVLGAFLRRLRGLECLERRFWQLLAAGVGSWLLVTLLQLVLPGPVAAWPAFALVRSLGYTAIYFWIFLALQLRPDAPTADPLEQRFRWLDGLGLALTAFALFVYLSVIPWALGAAVWGTNVPKVVLYLALDGVLLLRLSASCLRNSPRTWRPTYGCLFVVALFWTAADAFEVLRWAGWLSEAAFASLLDALWLPPLLALLLARQLRARSAEAEPAAAPPAPVRGSVLLGQALLLPFCHTLLAGLDAWEPARHPAAWLWALAVPVALGGLSAAYLRGVERLAAERAERLAEANHELAATVAALRAARDEATLANEAKTRFLAAMSHEIRTPMNGVLGNVSLLQRSELQAPQLRLVATIQRSGQALLAIIDEILDLSRLEAGRLRLRPASFDVGATVEEVAESLAPVAREKGLELSCLVQGLGTPLEGDRDRFRQIVVNLLGNAIKYTECGEVAVLVRVAATEADGVTVAVEVADTGIGIPREAAELVFEPFGQAASGRPSGNGAGLGLTISRQLAALMGGEIGFDSEPGRGSVFHLTVRLGRSPESAAPAAPPPLSVRRALVVEPLAIARSVLERQGAELGIEVRAVGDAPAALDALRHATPDTRYDVALVAASLIASDRGALVERLRQDPAAATARVIAVGAGDGRPAPGVCAVLMRPVLRRALLEALAPAPAAGDAAEAARPDPLPKAATAARRRLALVVEDNPVNQTVAEGMLGLLDFDAHVAHDGRAALERIERTRYDVVLMDCLMPGLDGYETTAELRRRERARGLPFTPVVAVTASAMSGDRERCLAAGMDDYLAKPFQIETLGACLARVLERAAAELVPAPAGASAG